MKVSLEENFEFEFFQIEELKSAEQYAKHVDGSIYSWKTTGKSNWLEKRLSVVDVLGLAVLPKTCLTGLICPLTENNKE
jgi:hypothetical protein